jgi:aryl-alcohol dehydrogenase-like predicted oxidoreductase
LTVTPLGLGGAYLGARRVADSHVIDEGVGIATVLRALELGIRLIDTSAGYLGGGQSERIIGQALGHWTANGGRREDLVISTKTGTRQRRERTAASYSATATRQSVEESLRLLGTDYLDVVLVHDPVDLTPVLAPDGAWTALREMKEEGIIRAMGLGVRNHTYHQRLIATGWCDVSLTHCDYNLVRQEAVAGVLEPAAARGVGVLNGTSLFHGMLLGDRSPREVVAERGAHWERAVAHFPDWAPAPDRAQQLWERCQEWGISLLALNLQFIAREERIAATLMGAASPAQIESDVIALNEPIPEYIWRELDSMLQAWESLARPVAY